MVTDVHRIGDQELLLLHDLMDAVASADRQRYDAIVAESDLQADQVTRAELIFMSVWMASKSFYRRRLTFRKLRNSEVEGLRDDIEAGPFGGLVSPATLTAQLEAHRSRTAFLPRPTLATVHSCVVLSTHLLMGNLENWNGAYRIFARRLNGATISNKFASMS